AQMSKAMDLLLLLLLLPCLSSLSLVFPVAKAAYDIVDFGASADGKTDSSNALLRAWSTACSSRNPSTINVPKGRFLLKPVVLNGPCNNTIKLWIQGTLVAPSSYDDKSSQWIGVERVDGLEISGGTLDGQGAALWACKEAGGSCPLGHNSLGIGHSKNVQINGLTSINSKLFHIAIFGSERVAVKGGKIIAPESSPNTDGIHVQMSSGITITGATIKTGDDCISIGPGTTDMWVERISCGPGHGVSIGSLGHSLQEDGVQNITLKTAVFTGTQNGVRIKTWGRESNGFVNGVFFYHAVMKDVQNPIVIDQNYCPGNKGCPNQDSGIKISQVEYRDIKGTSATEVAVSFDCSPSHPCRGIELQDIKLTYKNKPAMSYCKHADGTASGMVVPASCL
ncbi:hypothetical protein Taro_053461, partial [Colocasia esculenta]|nr:hypothetical protein [Colocasia esculenta]